MDDFTAVRNARLVIASTASSWVVDRSYCPADLLAA